MYSFQSGSHYIRYLTPEYDVIIGHVTRTRVRPGSGQSFEMLECQGRGGLISSVEGITQVLRLTEAVQLGSMDRLVRILTM